jgi:hypothetical protein
MTPRDKPLPAALLAVFLFGLAPVAASPPIYRCEINGVMTFSDRPCGAQSTAYEPEAARVSTYDASPVPKEAARARLQSNRSAATRSSIAADQLKRAEQCERIRTGLREIRSKMRAGYNAKEGERLKARYSKLNEQRRAERCN